MTPKELTELKADNDRLRAMRNHYRTRYACAICALVAFAACVATGFGAYWLGGKGHPRETPMQFISSPSRLQEVGIERTPDHILACVYFGCSGTIISKGERYAQGVGAAHCFDGVATGHRFNVWHADGSNSMATLESIDRANDLVMFRLPASEVLGVAPVAEAMPASKEIPYYEIVGYQTKDKRGPKGVGPLYRQATTATIPDNELVKDDTGKWRWVLAVKPNPAYGTVDSVEPGDSGCGVFVNGCLCAVISHRNNARQGKTLRACSHTDLLSFVRRHRDPDCGNGFCPVPKREDAPPAPAPRDGSDPAAQQKNAGWGPTPNFKLNLGEKNAGDPAPYDGQGRPPAGNRTPHQRSHEIADAFQRLEELESKLDALIKAGGAEQPAPLPGPPGKDGRDGKDGAQGAAGTPGLDGTGFDKATLNELQVADQRNAGEIAILKNEEALLKGYIDQLAKKQNDTEIKAQTQDVTIQRISDRISTVETKLSGSVKITVRRDTTGNVSLQQGK